MKLIVSTTEVRSVLAAKHGVAENEIEITTDGALPVGTTDLLAAFIREYNNPVNTNLNVIALIKAYRKVTGDGLYESKIAVETALGRR